MWEEVTSVPCGLLDKLVTLQYDRVMILGERIKNARKKLGLSRVKLAEMIGCSEFSIVNWETREVIPLPVYMEKLVEILGEQILKDDLDEEPN